VSIAVEVAGREHDLGGGFVVQRLLPAAIRKSVGPFVFLDHFGPTSVVPASSFDVRPHPHIGLATVTFLFDGAITHRDSLGMVQRIEPGDINWMVAGRGIVHSERRPADLAAERYVSHGIQLWAGLPREAEEGEPCFSHTPRAQLPVLRRDGADVRVLIGRAFGVESPVPTPMPTVYLSLALTPNVPFSLPPLAPELAVCAVDTELRLDDRSLPRGRLAVLEPEREVRIVAGSPARIIVIGGAPLDGPRYLWWNFVSSRKERILAAAEDWAAGRFAPVPGEHEAIPLPDRRPDFEPTAARAPAP
jgi:redox-sensitive bicupin YhaK (pirin superfamily)